jgi:A/G-specific adenine glycosylase
LATPVPTVLAKKRAFQGALLRWYARNGRVLPWRKNPSPYRTLVSEFMLQQTRVETAIPFFERFLKRFPNLRSLAQAPRAKVLLSWAGLGYYARARNLHRACRIILKDHEGKIPRRKADLLKLPGFGPYLAGAVASLAFGEPVAALDGNTGRVMTRLLGRGGDIRRKELEGWVEALLPPRRASDFNQALMDLGAMVCLPKHPRCPSCPLKNYCQWKGDNDREGWKKKIRLRNENWLVALIQKGDRFFLHRKEGRGLLAGLWQFPCFPHPDGMREEEREKKEWLAGMIRERFGLKIEVKETLPRKEAFFTHLHAILEPYRCEMKGRLPSASRKGERWVRPSDFCRLAVSAAMKKVAAMVFEGR